MRKLSICTKCHLAPVACKCGPAMPGINDRIKFCEKCKDEPKCKMCRWNQALEAQLRGALLAKR